MNWRGRRGKRIWRRTRRRARCWLPVSQASHGVPGGRFGYRGDYVRSREEFQAFHRPRVEALLDARADLLACETMPNFAELKALKVELLSTYPRARAWFSFTLRDAQHPATELARK